ncbi:HpcH/HpaI aldolase/citrate lyase family protein [Marivita sp. S6314]|uniref:HpcH/HpaI aldolase family protein n=1 Tax=Marivita sp. S6314 TaxID=2926406 RepID=UPI001FF2888C|nr:HpcH/HpaI aldolase/citrate lyase family protein [Marivita sp. S6314]MCK0150357.1 HpcH/HpaI aldolase/citrate lyase family protein [Marivita sp. S6314]
MPAPINQFKTALASDTPQFGLWLALANGYTAEIAATSGFDWLLLDGEHAPNDLDTLNTQLMALSGHDVSPVVRIPHNDPALIKQVLDMGAQTLLCPMVNSAREAQAIVEAMRYPPRGIRGVGHMLGRASGFNGVPDYLQTAEDQLCLIVQAESVAAIDALEEICAVDGVNGVFIGPADLCADMGLLPDITHPDVRITVRDGLARIRKAGKAAGIIDGDPDLIREDLDAGANFVALGADVLLLADAMRSLSHSWKTQYLVDNSTSKTT